jgi:hypothetical protein
MQKKTAIEGQGMEKIGIKNRRGSMKLLTVKRGRPDAELSKQDRADSLTGSSL